MTTPEDRTSPREKRDAVTLRHREEWERHRILLDAAIAAEDADLLKLAKLAAETLKIRQDAERRVWAISDRAEADGPTQYIFSWQQDEQGVLGESEAFAGGEGELFEKSTPSPLHPPIPAKTSRPGGRK